MVEVEVNQKLSYLHIDRSDEYLSNDFTNYLTSHCIWRQLTTAKTLQQNGIGEHKNRDLCETMRSLLFGANLLAYLWQEAVKTTNYISN